MKTDEISLREKFQLILSLVICSSRVFVSIGKGLGYKRGDSWSLPHITPLLSSKGTAYALYESRVSSQSSWYIQFSVEVFYLA